MTETRDPPAPPPPAGGGGNGIPPESIVSVQLEDEMRSSYLDYAMSVIIGRALPDVRDGLKPVHRRALFAMHEQGNFFNRAYKKSARIVGDVIGKYHPHGDVAVYDTIVRMAQPFSMRALLVDGQGNFGSVDGDPPAAMRYTEIRLTRLSGELLADLDKDTVDFQPNYDESLQEPLVLPNKFPNLLINGAQGIAVGMATSIPPHNLREVIDATIAVINKPAITLDEILKIIPGPDFPTGGIICGRDGIKRGYETGRGALKVRAVVDIEERKRGGQSIIVNELPYQVNKAKLIERIAELVGEKKLEGISDVRDESDRTGMRVVIELKRDAVPQVTLNQLWAHTQLEATFGINMLAIAHGQPKICSIKDCLTHFVEHRREVVTRRTAFELSEAEKKFHITVGLLIALDNIDRVIEIIRGSKDPAEAKDRLIAEPFKGLGNLQKLIDAEDEQINLAVGAGVVHLTDRQAQAILDLRLQRLTALESDRLREEARELRDQMSHLRGILADDVVLMKLITTELEELRDYYGDKRRTQITGEVGEYTDEDLIAEEEMVVTFSHAGYVKRTPTSEYKAQKRGGRGVSGQETREEDFVEHLFVASTHAYLLVFTNLGRVYWLKVHNVPAGARTSKGKPLVNLVQLGEGEKMSAILPIKEWSDNAFVITVSKKGTVKKTALSEYSRPRATGIIGVGVDEGDEIIAVNLTTNEQDILLGTKNGMAIRFKASNVRSMGRPSVGVRGIKLDERDEVVGMAVLDSGTTILTLTANGYGKRTKTEEYRPQGRGGRGLILIKTSDRNGPVVGVRQVIDSDHIMIITTGGNVIRMTVRDISILGRNTQGVRLVRLEEGDLAGAVYNLEEADEEDLQKPVESAADAPADESAGDGAADGDASDSGSDSEGDADSDTEGSDDSEDSGEES